MVKEVVYTLISLSTCDLIIISSLSCTCLLCFPGSVMEVSDEETVMTWINAVASLLVKLPVRSSPNQALQFVYHILQCLHR